MTVPASLGPAPMPASVRALADGPARVLICDDSAVIRAALARLLGDDPRVRVVAGVANGQLAIEAVRRQPIDVLVLDIDMPVMDGLTALPLLLRADPDLRVIMASTLTRHGAAIAMRALCLGAADYVPKPDVAAMRDDRFRAELLARIKGLARLRRTITGAATPVPRTAAPTIPLATTPLATTPLATPLAIRSGRARPPIARPAPLLLAVGCSTGGPRALLTLIRHLGPAPLPVPVVITQHLPPMFTALLAEQLAGVGGPPCAEARDGDVLLPGHAWLAPGGHHLLIESGADGCLRARLSTAPPENHCRPSADPMLRSASAACGGRVLVVMLTGMGQDGLAGTRAVVAAGGTAIAQDEATSVVWGMPGAIARAGLCDQVLPLPGIADRVRHLLRPAGP